MDRFYNERAAAWARDLVMKMDDGEAQEFVTHVTREVLLDDIAANRRTLNGHVMEIQKRLMDAADRVVSKGVLTPTAVVVDITKAFGTDPYARNQHGRFSTTESRVRVDRRKPPSDQKKHVSPATQYMAAGAGAKAPKLSRSELSAYQQQYTQLAAAMQHAQDQGNDGVRAILEDKVTGDRSVTYVTDLGDFTRKNNGVNWNPATQNLVAVSGSGSALGNAPRFDMISALGTAQPHVNAFQQQWSDARGDTPGTNERTYRRIETGSKLLGAVPNEKAKAAAAFGEFVGQYGPEAEKVIGPAARKTAYRYRGTERAPDKELAEMRLQKVKEYARPTEDLSVHQIAARRAGGPAVGVTPEQKIEATTAAATTYLGRRLPSLKLAEIQVKSGKIPPSEGVIIDRNGQIAHQAVGFAEDHYLPFNLKNLKSLKDGAYVRRRTKGGLSTEDIYTGLVSGAREVTVVSNSGVFTIEFEDDFRGVRRFNDKAAGMVDRYAKTLDAIQHGNINREELSPDEKARIRSEVEEEAEDYGYNRREAEEMIADRIKNYRADTTLSERELRLIDAQAAAGAREGSQREAGDIRRRRQELIEDATEAKRDRKYRLDGEGYAAALESLKEQYPYYIKSVSYTTKRQGLHHSGERSGPGGGIPDRAGKITPFSGGPDQGYVKPRHNRPDEVQEGYYDAEITGHGKMKASHTNYQNWEHNPNNTHALARSRNASGSPAPAPPTPTASTSPVTVAATGATTQAATVLPTATTVPAGHRAPQPQSVRQQLTQASRQASVQQQMNTHLKTAVAAAGSAVGATTLAGYPTVAAAVKDPDDILADPTRREALETELANLAKDGAQAAPAMAATVSQSLAAMKLSLATVGGQEWTTEALGTSPQTPYKFEGKKTLENVDRQLKDRGVSDEVRAITDDAQLREISRQVGIAAKAVENGSYHTGTGQTAYMAGMNAMGMDEQRALTLYVNAHGGIDSNEANRLRVEGALVERLTETARAIEHRRYLLAQGQTDPTSQDKEIHAAVDQLIAGIPASVPVPAGGHLKAVPPVKRKSSFKQDTPKARVGLIENMARIASDEEKPRAADMYKTIAGHLRDGDIDAAANLVEDDLPDLETDMLRIETLGKIIQAFYED